MDGIGRKGDANDFQRSSRGMSRCRRVAAYLHIFFFEGVRKAMRGVGRKDDPDGSRSPYEMEADRAKLADIAICLMMHAERRGVDATRSRLLDALFLADVGHLNEYGRPISYDHYDATASGPVARTFDAMLSDDVSVLMRIGAVRWVRTKAEQESGDTFKTKEGLSSATLTPSDGDALRTSMDKVIDCVDGSAGATTKPHAAYTEAWRSDAERRAFAMDFSLFFDPPDEEEAGLLAWMSRGRL